MTQKLLLTFLLAVVLSCAGTVNAVVFYSASGRKLFTNDLPYESSPPDQDICKDADLGMREMMVKPKPQPALPPIPNPKPKPQPKPKPRATPIPTPAPTPKKPVTRPS